MTTVNHAVPSDGPKVGLYPGLKRSQYEAIAAINFSTLKHFERTPAHARAAMLHPPAPTEEMEFGTAFHCAVLEQQRFMETYAVAPKCDRRTTEGKRAWAEFEAEHQGMELLKADDFNDVQRMRDSIWKHPIAKQVLGGLGHSEVGIVFEVQFENMQGNEVTELGKSLIDRLGQFDSWSWVVDVKSCADAGRSAFAKTIRKLHYGAQAAFYLDACNTVAPRKRRFMWIASEKTPPFEVAIYEADESALSAGRSKYMRWLRLFEESRRLGRWSGYPAEIQQMGSEDTEWRFA